MSEYYLGALQHLAATFKGNGSAFLVFLERNQEKIFEMQRALASKGIMMAPMSTNFGYSDQGRYTDQSRRIEIGGTEEQIIPIPREELQVGKR
jgi:hypothetical protein